MKGFPYTEMPDRIKRAGGSMQINPLSRLGQSPMWKAAKRAEKAGLITIRRIKCDLAILGVKE